MKKTLAILLALLTAATVALTACSPDDREPADNNDDDDIDYVEDEDTDDKKPKDTSDNDDDKNNGNSNNEEEDDKVPAVLYAGVELRLRSSTSTSSENNVVKTVPFGTKLNYVATSGSWYKVTLDGDSAEYYVQSKWLASGNAAFSFTDCEDADLTVETTSNKVVFYNSPFVCEDLETALQNALLGDGFLKTHFMDGYKLTAVATNSGWVKVEFVGTIKLSENKTATYAEANPGVFYVQMKSFTEGRISGLNTSGGSGSVGGIG